jgi:CubicO group peptidase (beta-lactamase class C family)
MTLVDDGRLDLDKDISEYLGYEVRNPHFPDTAINTAMLIRHTSSLFDPDEYIRSENKESPETTQRFLESGDCFSQWQPGSEYKYSPYLAYAVVALICEQITDKRFDTFAREALFEPMGIDAAYLPVNLQVTDNISTLYGSNHEVYYSIETQLEAENPESPRFSDHDRGGANLVISAVDYSKIINMLSNRGVYNDINILSDESVMEVHRFTGENDFDVGMGVFLQSDTSYPFSNYFYHTGGAWGAQTQFKYHFDENAVRSYVVLATGTNSDVTSSFYTLHMEMSIAAMQYFKQTEKLLSEATFGRAILE